LHHSGVKTLRNLISLRRFGNGVKNKRRNIGEEKMESYLDKAIAPLIGCIGAAVISIIGYVYKRKRDEQKNKKLGVMIISSLLEEVNTGLNIIKNKLNVQLPKKSWEGMKTIPDEVMLIITAVSKGIKPDGFPPEDIKIHCKNYFEHITQNWMHIQNNQKAIQDTQESTEKVIKMLEQTKSLLMENSKNTVQNSNLGKAQ